MPSESPIGDSAIGDSPDDDFEFWTIEDVEFTPGRIPVIAQARSAGVSALSRITGVSA